MWLCTNLALAIKHLKLQPCLSIKERQTVLLDFLYVVLLYLLYIWRLYLSHLLSVNKHKISIKLWLFKLHKTFFLLKTSTACHRLFEYISV